jgi:GT2 family glycosyltransferase
MIHAIIPVHNRLSLTIKCLKSLKKQKYVKDLNIIIVDDASTDGTREYVKKNFPEITILSGNGSLFWGGAVNKGIEYVITIAKCNDWVLLANNDIEFSSNAVEELLNAAEEKKRKSLVGALTVNLDDRQTVIKSGTVVESWFLNKTKHVYKGLKLSEISSKKTIKVDFITGRCLIHPVEIFFIAGNYDSKNFIHYGRDDEFSMRVKKHGFQTLICPNSIVFIKESNQAKKNISIESFLFIFFNIKSSSNIINKFKLSFRVAPSYAKLSFFVFGIFKSFYIFFKR